MRHEQTHCSRHLLICRLTWRHFRSTFAAILYRIDGGTVENEPPLYSWVARFRQRNKMPRNTCLVCQTTRCKDPVVILHRSQTIKWSASGAALAYSRQHHSSPLESQLYSDGSFSTAPPSIVLSFTALHVPIMVVLLHCILRSCSHEPSSMCCRRCTDDWHAPSHRRTRMTWHGVRSWEIHARLHTAESVLWYLRKVITVLQLLHCELL